MSAELIRGKIAAVVTDTTVIINRGRQAGVKEGMVFAVLIEIPEIVDPDDESNCLTELTFEKGRIEVTQVFKKMAYGKLQGRATPRPWGAAYTVFVEDQVQYPKVEASALIKEADWTIKAGDAVRSVTTSNEEATGKSE